MMTIRQMNRTPIWMIVYKVISRILVFFIVGITVPVIFVNLMYIFKMNLNPKEIPDIFGIKMLSVISGSMEDYLMIGDAILIQETMEINLGDIITFWQTEDELITHRVIRIEDENGILKYITKGDNNNTEDREKVNIDKIEGKVIFRLAKIGEIVTFLKTPMGMIFLIGLPTIWIMLVHYSNQKIVHKKLERKLKRLEFDNLKNKHDKG